MANVKSHQEIEIELTHTQNIMSSLNKRIKQRQRLNTIDRRNCKGKRIFAHLKTPSWSQTIGKKTKFIFSFFKQVRYSP